MVLLEWMYSTSQPSPYIELECTAEELAEAKEKLTEYGFMCWVQNVASGEPHARAMEWAIEEDES